MTQFRVIIDIDVELNGASVEEIRANILAGIEYIAGIKKITQDTNAEVLTFNDKIYLIEN